MRTTLDIDETVLREAESQARKRGKPLAALIEEVLRATILVTSAQPETLPPSQAADGLEDSDPFFSALEEIRDMGRMPAPHREVQLS